MKVDIMLKATKVDGVYSHDLKHIPMQYVTKHLLLTKSLRMI